MFKLIVFVIALGTINFSYAGELDWKISRQWNPSEETLYSEFIRAMGAAVKDGTCSTANNCIKNPKANPLFYNSNPRSLRNIFADCADLPYVLRAYFAFMRELPLVFPNGVTFYNSKLDELIKEYNLAKQGYDRYTFFNRPRRIKIRYRKAKKELENFQKIVKRDIRYSRSGNKITSLKRIKTGDNINSILNQVVNSVSTAVFRVNGGLFDTGPVFRDTYPIDITRKAIIPGTMLYDTAGHIGIVVEVTESGKIYLMDAHPDNSITYISFGEKFTRSPIQRGAGFVRFRPYQLQGSRYIPTQNSDISDFSLVQYYGTEDDRQTSWKKVAFYFNGVSLPFIQFVRARLSLNGLSINPLEEANVMFNDLCRDFLDRVSSVETAIDDRIDKKTHPRTLPDNIYGTNGEWEVYSTPSRDARLKASVREIYNTLATFIGVGDPPNFSIDYDGTDLNGDLLNIYNNLTSACMLKIRKSNQQIRTMNLNEAIDRLFKLSFNPYMCSELRWGLSGNERSTCSQDNIKWDWYQASQYLRNQIDRDYTQFMGYDLGGLINSNLGVRETPEYDFQVLLQ